MPPGTRICVLGADGFGLGRVTSAVGRSSGANEHTVQFDRGLTRQLDLKRARWTVQPGDMGQLRAEQEAAEAERAVKRCFQEVTGAQWPGGTEQREAEDMLQQWIQLRLGADGEPCADGQLKQAIRSTDLAARVVVKRCFQEVTGAPWPGGMEQREADDNLQKWLGVWLGKGEPCTDEQLKEAIRHTDGVIVAAADQVRNPPELRALTFLLTDSLDCAAREGGQAAAARHADLRARRGLRPRPLHRVPRDRRRGCERAHDRVRRRADQAAQAQGDALGG